MNNEMSKIWPGWNTVRSIGDGSFGVVYEIERDVFGQKEKAALKVITIPQSSSDVDELRSEGYDNSSITKTFRRYLEDIVNEYSLMRKLNGSANVVNCDDVRYVQHDDGFGWDIYIKMELVTPLTKVIGKTVPDDQVIQIGSDICKALILCKKHNIIHRDIKPANIFVSENGDYKLGDFGIAKTVEKTTSQTKIGTYDYMAPEVYHDEPYGSTADIYSLGLVLYWLLNERRTPFLPLPPERPGNSVRNDARKRRFNGEALPAPVHGDQDLQSVVLKACAYNSEDRYQTPEEFYDALLNAQSGTVGWEWVCKKCGTRNNHSSQRCKKCRAKKNSGRAEEEWVCKTYGFRNELATQVCENCGTRRFKRKFPLWAGVCGFLAIILFAGAIVSPYVPSTLSTLIGNLLPSREINNSSSVPMQSPTPTAQNATTKSQSQSHEWGTPSYSWSNSYSSCTAMRKCSQCGEIEKETAPSTPRVMSAATCTTSGETTYTATFQTAAFTTQQATTAIPALGHNWIAATFSQPKTCSNCNLTEGWPSPTTVPPTLNELQAIMKSGRISTTCKADSGELVSLELPSYNELLDYPFRAVIAGGNGDYPNIFIMPKHKSGNGDLGVIRKGTEVWIVGKYEGKTSEGTIFTYYFFVADDGVMGWNNKNFFVRK